MLMQANRHMSPVFSWQSLHQSWWNCAGV